ncbi:MAG: GNAT family N-acetyltransferase [Bacteroidetes bacterium]|nr:MAG: GNAT family N-acetyltransferase [Bacteroidota bacterium]
MIHSTLVSTENELLQIHGLNQKNLKANISYAERQKEGFVSWLYPVDLLRKMNELAPSVIIKDDDNVVGYALVTLKESSMFHADLRVMFENLRNVQFLNQPLFDRSFYIMGQICVDKDYRGLGLVNKLYQKHYQQYCPQYDLLVTEISSSNIRSQKAHEKVGFKTIYTYRDQVDEWNVVVWDWNASG